MLAFILPPQGWELNKKDLSTNHSDVIFIAMVKIVGYMLTWTTYGTWLQGDEKGYVKKGKILPGNEKLEKANRKLQKLSTINLTKKEKEVVCEAILKAAEPCGESIEQIISRYKNIAMFALRKNGRSSCQIWTSGFDKRFCFTEEDLENRTNYVNNHKK